MRRGTEQGDKHIYGTEEERVKMLKDLKKSYEKHRLTFKDYILQTKYVEKYWVIEEAVKEENPVENMEETHQETYNEMVTKEEPMDLSGAYNKKDGEQ